jgi:toxin ParE1/3/4
MEYRVKLSEQAAVDLDKIMGYISDELYNPQAAERFYHLVHEKLGLLSENPHMYPLHHYEKLRGKGIRFAVIGNYLLLYIADDIHAVVNIARILYSKRDIPPEF